MCQQKTVKANQKQTAAGAGLRAASRGSGRLKKTYCGIGM